MRRSKWLFILLIVLMGICLVACGDDDGDEDESSNKKKPTEAVNEVTPTDKVVATPTERESVTPTAGPTDEPVATPTAEPTPTEEITTEPTPEVKKDYDPEIVVDFDKNNCCYAMYYFYNVETFGLDGSRVGVKLETTSESDYYNYGGDPYLLNHWEDFCNEHNLFYDTYSGTSPLFPIPWDKETMYITSPLFWEYEMLNDIKSCVVFVKEGTDFNMNDLLAKARLEKGEDYTIDELIRSNEYANVLFFDPLSDEANGVKLFRNFGYMHQIDIHKTFPEQGVYKGYVYVYVDEMEEWHRIENEYLSDHLKYNVFDYSEIGLVLWAHN